MLFIPSNSLRSWQLYGKIVCLVLAMANERQTNGTQVCLVRMQSDARLPVAERLGYRNIGNALYRISKEEGLRTYWRGATPTGTIPQTLLSNPVRCGLNSAGLYMPVPNPWSIPQDVELKQGYITQPVLTFTS